MQPPILRQLTEEDLSTSYDLELSETGTTLRLEVIGESAEQAVDTAARLVEFAPDLLDESLGEVDAGSVTVEQATTGSPDDAEEVGDGTYRYSTVIVVGPAARVTLNPFPASLATVRSLVAVAESLPFLVEVSEAGADATFEVTGNVRETPLMDISVSAASPDEAIESHEIIVGELQNELDDLQAGALIEAEARTQMFPLVEATYPIATASSQVRPVAAIVVLGSGLAIGLATLLEAFAADRRRRRDLTSDPDGFASAMDETHAAVIDNAGAEFADGGDVEPVVESVEAPVFESVEATAGPVDEPVAESPDPTHESVDATPPAVDQPGVEPVMPRLGLLISRASRCHASGC